MEFAVIFMISSLTLILGFVILDKCQRNVEFKAFYVGCSISLFIASGYLWMALSTLRNENTLTKILTDFGTFSSGTLSPILTVASALLIIHQIKITATEQRKTIDLYELDKISAELKSKVERARTRKKELNFYHNSSYKRSSYKDLADTDINYLIRIKNLNTLNLGATQLERFDEITLSSIISADKGIGLGYYLLLQKAVKHELQHAYLMEYENFIEESCLFLFDSKFMRDLTDKVLDLRPESFRV